MTWNIQSVCNWIYGRLSSKSWKIERRKLWSNVIEQGNTLLAITVSIWTLVNQMKYSLRIFCSFPFMVINWAGMAPPENLSDTWPHQYRLDFGLFVQYSHRAVYQNCYSNHSCGASMNDITLNHSRAVYLLITTNELLLWHELVVQLVSKHLVCRSWF